MAPKRDPSEKDAPGKKTARKSITLEQKMEILRRYDQEGQGEDYGSCKSRGR